MFISIRKFWWFTYLIHSHLFRQSMDYKSDFRCLLFILSLLICRFEIAILYCINNFWIWQCYVWSRKPNRNLFNIGRSQWSELHFVWKSLIRMTLVPLIQPSSRYFLHSNVCTGFLISTALWFNIILSWILYFIP